MQPARLPIAADSAIGDAAACSKTADETLYPAGFAAVSSFMSV
jgi:hypothetical protein